MQVIGDKQLTSCKKSFVSNTCGMAKKGRQPDRYETHTPESMAQVASDLDQMAARLRFAAGILLAEPKIQAVQMRLETSLTDGLTMLRNWVDEAHWQASDTRRETAKNQPRVRKNGHAGEVPAKREKNPAETTIDDGNSAVAGHATKERLESKK